MDGELNILQSSVWYRPYWLVDSPSPVPCLKLYLNQFFLSSPPALQSRSGSSFSQSHAIVPLL